VADCNRKNWPQLHSTLILLSPPSSQPYQKKWILLFSTRLHESFDKFTACFQLDISSQLTISNHNGFNYGVQGSKKYFDIIYDQRSTCHEPTKLGFSI